MGDRALSHANIIVSQSGPAVVVALSGTLGLIEVDLLEGQFVKIADTRPSLVVVDLSAVQMMGSSAIGSLVGFRGDIAKSGGVVRLAAVTPLVLESLKRALLDKLFKIYDTVQQAVDAPVTK